MAKKALLFVNNKKPAAVELSKKICEFLKDRFFTAEVFMLDNKTETCEAKNADICFCLGGDGTVLYAARIMAPLGTPILPINLGTLGFISAVPPAEWQDTFSLWEQGKAAISRRLMLEISVEREGRIVFSGCCLNDVVISMAGIAKLISLNIEVENPAGEKINLGRFRADGVVIATPTGSTGYSVAAGGPIIDPEMDSLIINPICPFTLANRPIVLPSDGKIITFIEPEQRSPVLLTADGQITEPLKNCDKIFVRRFPHYLSLIASNRRAFYRALKSKLAWDGGDNA